LFVLVVNLLLVWLQKVAALLLLQHIERNDYPDVDPDLSVSQKVPSYHIIDDELSDTIHILTSLIVCNARNIQVV
jgi:hypothetical protein